MIRPLLAAALATLASCCSPTPTPHPVEAETGGPSSAETCAHLAAVCGVDPQSCQRKVDQVAADRLTIFPRRCWLAAQTPAAVNACGQITCVGPLP